MNFNIIRYDTVESTNTEAAKQAKLGADEGLCIIAGEQTAGRGRYGRTWVSEKNAGLYFSIVLRPKLEPRSLPLTTLMTGVAVYDALREFGIQPDIKWVNDILVGDKKISGILAETVDTPRGLAVVVGIGVNITSRNFPDEIANLATSIEAETGKRVATDELAEVLTRYLSYFYNILSGGGTLEIVEQWRKRSSYF
ncbi:MAG: biotin--[acetyl-CoA-carboxylase] ligase, partial [Acidobacteriota bacterium]